MDRILLNKLHNTRLPVIRRGVLEVGKFGMSDTHYLEHLKRIEDQCRLAREDIERGKYQLPIEFPEGSDAA